VSLKLLIDGSVMINQIIDFIVFTLDICLERTKFRFQDIEMIEHAADVLLKSSSTEFKVVFFHILGKFGNILIVEKGVLDQLVLVAMSSGLNTLETDAAFSSPKSGA